MNRIVRLWTKGYRSDGGAYQGEMRRLISSCDRFPAHEVNYPVLDRLLWHVKKESRQKPGKDKA